MTVNFGLRVESRQQLSQQSMKPIIENSLSMPGLAASEGPDRHSLEVAYSCVDCLLVKLTTF